jgi:hypothetical protein
MVKYFSRTTLFTPTHGTKPGPPDTMTTGAGGWHSEPLERGTFSLLKGCAVTLFLCAWTMLHLHIPEQGGGLNNTYRRGLAAIVALIAPDWTIVYAYEQNRSAKRLYCRLNPGIRKQPSVLDRFAYFLHLRNPTASQHQQHGNVPNNDAMHIWSVAHCHYVLMGGLALRIGPELAPTILTGDGLDFLLKRNQSNRILPTFQKAYVEGQGRSSWVSKALMAYQGIWYSVAVAQRWAANLPVPLLEVATFAHTIMALPTIILWRRKPHDVQTPTIIEANSPVFPLIAVASFHHIRRGRGPRFQFGPVDHPVRHVTPNDGEGYLVEPGDTVYGFHYRGMNNPRSNSPDRTSMLLSADNVALLKRARDAVLLLRSPGIFDVFEAAKDKPLVIDRVRNYESGSVLQQGFAVPVAAQTIYGCLYLVSWMKEFESLSAQWQWRAAILFLCAQGALSCVLQHRSCRAGLTLHRILLFVSIVCRISMASQCVEDLWHLPLSAYKMPAGIFSALSRLTLA